MSEFATALAVMCGLPLSGKSTYVQQLRREAPWVVVCPDDIRLALHGRGFFPSAEGFVWATAELAVRAMLRGEQMVLVDGTNSTRKRRKAWLDIAKEFDVPLLAYVVTTPAPTCKDRALACNEPDMVPVIDRMSEAWEPVKEEGIEVVGAVDGIGVRMYERKNSR